MDLTSPGLSYILLLLPTLIAVAVVGQGVSKVVRKEHDGIGVLCFGVGFVVLIGTAYWFFIR